MSYLQTRVIPNAIVFISGLCIMVVELVAGRLVAKHIGSSLYTWTSIIGVILAGISIGNWLGGKLADRYRPEGMLGFLFLISSALTLSMLWLENVVGADLMKLVNSTLSTNAEMSWPLRTAATVALVFFWPACALGTISPVVAKMALDRSQQVGSTVGNIYAWGTAGSIIGTFLTGFFLISFVGTRGVICSVAGLLAFMGVLLGSQQWLLQGTWAGLVIAVVLPTVRDLPAMIRIGALLRSRDDVTTETVTDDQGELRDVVVKTRDYHDESNYYAVTVYDQSLEVYDTRARRDLGLQSVKVLTLDHLVHSYVWLGHPEMLAYDYEHIYASVTERVSGGEGKPLKTLFIGGGGYSFPRFIEAVYPRSAVHVAEIDPAVTKAAHEVLGLPGDTSIVTTHGDARNFVDDTVRRNRAARRAGKDPMLYDYIYGDAFNDFSVPWHLTTLEFNQKLKEIMTPDGVYLINLIDIYPLPELKDGQRTFDKGLGRFLAAFINTANQVFGHTDVFSTDLHSLSKDRDTFVVACSTRHLDLDDLGRNGEREFRGYRLSESEIKDLLNLHPPTDWRNILTDDFAPVDNMLAEVVKRGR